MSKNIILVGLGPHAKRIYINLMKKHGVLPLVIIDLEKNKKSIINYLRNEKIYCDTYFVPNEEADNLTLSKKVQSDIRKLLKKNNIQYSIISTEPKAHFAYAKFFLKENINILMDKPISAPMFVFENIKNSREIKKEYDILKREYIKKII